MMIIPNAPILAHFKSLALGVRPFQPVDDALCIQTPERIHAQGIACHPVLVPRYAASRLGRSTTEGSRCHSQQPVLHREVQPE